jgi:DNA polymerase I-like protein with 3'-5' exonuclease and polymerase domains
MNSVLFQANRWCARGVDLLASQHIEKCSTSPELAEQSLVEIQQYVASAEEFKLSSPKEFRSLFQDSITPETKALVTQVSEAVQCIPRLDCQVKLSLHLINYHAMKMYREVKV